jgi:uncharacterized membrane protein YkoI
MAQFPMTVLTPKVELLMKSLAKVTLNDATTKALSAVGPGSISESTDLILQNGSLVYNVFVIDSNNNFHRVYVDAVNGKILSNTKTIATLFLR